MASAKQRPGCVWDPHIRRPRISIVCLVRPVDLVIANFLVMRQGSTRLNRESSYCRSIIDLAAIAAELKRPR